MNMYVYHKVSFFKQRNDQVFHQTYQKLYFVGLLYGIEFIFVRSSRVLPEQKSFTFLWVNPRVLHSNCEGGNGIVPKKTGGSVTRKQLTKI